MGKCGRFKFQRKPIKINHNIQKKIGNTSFEEKTNSTTQIFTLDSDERVLPNEYKKSNSEEFTKDDDMAEILLEILYEKITSHVFLK